MSPIPPFCHFIGGGCHAANLIFLSQRTARLTAFDKGSGGSVADEGGLVINLANGWKTVSHLQSDSDNRLMINHLCPDSPNPNKSKSGISLQRLVFAN